MPKVVDREQVRAELVEGCVEQFAAHGYTALTMRKVARALGVSTGTLYHYFPNKQAIFLAVVEHVIRLDTFATEGLLGLDPVDRLDAVLAYVDANRARFEQHLMVLTEVLRIEAEDSPLRATIHEASHAYVLGITALLDLPSPQAGRLVLSLINGVLCHDLFEGSLAPSPTRFADLGPAIRGLLIGRST